MINRLQLSLSLRVILGGFLVWCLLAGRHDLAIEFGIPFVLTLPIFYAGKTDKDFYLVDSLFSILFLAALGVSYGEAWPGFYSWHSIDKAFHTLAGAILGSLGVLYYRRKLVSKPQIIIAAFLAALAIGAGWEVFEWLISLLPPGFMVPSTGYEDTMMDLIADGVGALIGGWVFYSLTVQSLK